MNGLVNRMNAHVKYKSLICIGSEVKVNLKVSVDTAVDADADADNRSGKKKRGMQKF